MKVHFTHIDDIGVAYDLLNPNSEPNIICQWRFEAVQKRWPILFSGTNTAMEFVCNIPVRWERLWRISQGWTYAPFQFWLTQSFLDPTKNYSYEEIKYWGRLPSFIFFVIGLMAFFLLLKYALPGFRNHKTIALAITLMAGFSLEQRIMAAQMESYAIGLLANCVAIWALIQLRCLNNLPYRWIMIYALALSVSISMQYQAIPLVFSGLLAIFIFDWRNIMGLPTNLLKLASLISLTVFLTYCFIGDITHLSHRGISWNAGPGDQYIVTGNTLFERGLSLLVLIFNKSSYNYYSVISSIQLSPIWANIFGVAIIFVSALGALNLFHNRKVNTYRFFLLLSVIYLITYLLLIFLGRLSFSPTRHLLFFMPFMLIMFGYGLQFIGLKIDRPLIKRFSLIALFTYLIISIATFQDFYEMRVDNLSDQFFKQIVVDRRPDFVLASPNDIEDVFMLSMANTKTFLYLEPINCKGSKIGLGLNEYSVIWYNKRIPVPLLSKEFNNYMKALASNCLSAKDGQEISVHIAENLYMKHSNTEIDLSNYTKNGSNSYYFQLIKVKLH